MLRTSRYVLAWLYLSATLGSILSDLEIAVDDKYGLMSKQRWTHLGALCPCYERDVRQVYDRTTRIRQVTTVEQTTTPNGKP